MTREMADSTSIYADPLGEQVILYYCDGIYAVNETTVRARFPKAVLVACSAVGTNSGVLGDVEPGCMTIPQAIAWLKERRAANVWASLYCNEIHGWAPLRAAIQAAGIPEPPYVVADFDNIPVIPPGAIGKQYENATQTGGHFDRSIVADFWPGVDAPGGVMTDSDLGIIHDRMQFAVWGTVDTSAQSKADFIYAVNHGTSIASIDAGWRANAQASKWQAELVKLNTPIPTPVPDPVFNIHYTFTPSSSSAPVNETVSLKDAVAFAKQFEAQNPGVVVSIEVVV